MRRTSLLCLVFESTHSFPHFRSRNFGLQLRAHILELLFRSLPVASSKRVCLAPASKYVARPICSYNCERVLPLGSYVYFSREGLTKSVHNQLGIRMSFWVSAHATTNWQVVKLGPQPVRQCVSAKCPDGVILLEQGNRPAIKVSRSDKDFVYESVPSLSVLWLKICDRCVATMICFPAHQGLDCYASCSISTTSNIWWEKKQRNRESKNYLVSRATEKQMKTNESVRSECCSALWKLRWVL